MSHDPDYTHTFADRHPQFILEDVRVPDEARLGAIGAADDLTNEWFVEERIHIGARCTGRWSGCSPSPSSGRPIGSSSASGSTTSRASASPWPIRRPTPRRPGSSPGRPPGWRTTARIARSSTPRRRWPSSSRPRRPTRCADRVVQVFGGRGYMREFPAERYLRELRVDRIWEGTSEIQRLVIARALERRGVDRVVRMTAARSAASGFDRSSGSSPRARSRSSARH